MNPTHSNVLSINGPSLSYTLLSALLTYLYYPVNAKPKLILYHPYITYATYIAYIPIHVAPEPVDLIHHLRFLEAEQVLLASNYQYGLNQVSRYKARV